MNSFRIIKSSESLIREIQKYKLKKKKIGFVHTLGGIQKVQIKLIKTAKKRSDIVIVSIFLNPLQFNLKKDLKKYPKNLINDKKKIRETKANILYIPTFKEVFSNKKIKKINSSDKANKLCGKSRKGHFNGVVTVLKSLFKQVSPDEVFFGEKDFQQILVVKDLIMKYKLKIKIFCVSTVRDNFGLAYSSRNKLLTKKEQKIAFFLFKTIKEIYYETKKNFKMFNVLKRKGINKLIKYGFSKVDYLEIYNEKNLSKKKMNKKNFRIFVAANLGTTRLIDNYKN